jgi:hypothetical protein
MVDRTINFMVCNKVLSYDSPYLALCKTGLMGSTHTVKSMTQPAAGSQRAGVGKFTSRKAGPLILQAFVGIVTIRKQTGATERTRN